MGVENVMESFSGTGGGVSNNGRKARRVFTIMLDGADEFYQAGTVARQASGVPRYGELYPNDAGLRCTQINAEALTSSFFKITCNYTTFNYSAADDPRIQHPCDQPAKITSRGTVITVPFDVAYDDEGELKVPIVNSAGEPFDPPLIKAVYISTWSITKNANSFSDRVAEEVRDSTNSSPYRGYEAGTCLMVAYDATEIITPAYTYFEVQAEIQKRSEGWLRRVLDQGYRKKVKAEDGTIEYEVITDKGGVPLSQPSKLDGDGGVLADGKDPVWIDFRDKRQVDWDYLGI